MISFLQSFCEKKIYLSKFGQSTKNNKIRKSNLLKMALTPSYKLQNLQKTQQLLVTTESEIKGSGSIPDLTSQTDLHSLTLSKLACKVDCEINSGRDPLPF